MVVLQKHSSGKRLRLVLLLIGIIFFLLPPLPLRANAAEPPAVIILVNHEPEDLKIELKGQVFTREAHKKQVAWETYYLYYQRDFENLKELTLMVRSNGQQFELPLDLKKAERTAGEFEYRVPYNLIFTLDLKNRTLLPGTLPWRWPLLIGIRLVLTLITEGLIFYLFAYRKKHSWKVFFIFNLITQGLLNLLISGSTPLSYVQFTLIGIEIIILFTELIGFQAILKEHSKGRAMLYAIVANLASFFLGLQLITHLPI